MTLVTWAGEQMPPAIQELLKRAQTLKQEGNELHINKEFAAAVAKYEEAKAALATIVSWPQAASLARSCSLNEASCHLQLSDWDKVAEICTAVLATDRRNLKALYRRCVNPGVCACDGRRMYVDR